MILAFVVFGLLMTGLICCLALDGVIPIAPWLRLANLPFRGQRASNGVIFAISLFSIAMLAKVLFTGAGILE
jgi:hypothetical protein